MNLRAALRDLLGADHVSDDPEACALATADLFPAPGAVPAELVIFPRDTGQTAAALRLVAAAGGAVVPRGAGLSYTGGMTAAFPCVVVDTARMVWVRVDPENLAAIVGAGVTWQALADALAPHGLRSAQSSPISGAVSTIGGAAAQAVPGGMDGFLGVVAVLADGCVVKTGALALADAPAFSRVMGPDLTGMFLGDCGAFGVKTELAIRLAPERESAFASFAFDEAGAMMAVLVAVMRRGLVARALAMDPVRGSEATKVDAMEALRIAGAVAARAGGLRQAARDVAQLARAGSPRGEPAWSLHLTAEGVTGSSAEAGIAASRAIALAGGGREIAPAVPKALRARPYSIRGFVGPEGERWVPVHGILPLGAAEACLRAVEVKIAALRPELAAAGITVSHIVSALGASVVIEPMFYWRDALDPLHMRHLSARNRARFEGVAPNFPARDLVRAARESLAALMDSHGAVHTQIGRHYPLTSRMDEAGRALLGRIKAALDPAGRMNPGVLGRAC